MIYHDLWNLYRPDEETCEFEVTQADMFCVGKGTDRWIRRALETLGVGGEPSSFQVRACRCSYFSDHTDPKHGWRSRWSRAWAVTATLAGAPPLAGNTLFKAPIGFDELDPTGDDEEDQLRYNRTALFLCDLRADREAADRLTDELIQSAGFSESIRIEQVVRRFEETLHQIRIFFDGIVFPDDASALDRLTVQCRAAGGAPNWRDRLTWPSDEVLEMQKKGWRKLAEEMGWSPKPSSSD